MVPGFADVFQDRSAEGRRQQAGAWLIEGKQRCHSKASKTNQSRGTFHVHSFQGSFFLESLRKPRENSCSLF